eukprot:2100552-Pleurochrysis_carterae.AAC.1
MPLATASAIVGLTSRCHFGCASSGPGLIGPAESFTRGDEVPGGDCAEFLSRCALLGDAAGGAAPGLGHGAARHDPRARQREQRQWVVVGGLRVPAVGV